MDLADLLKWIPVGPLFLLGTYFCGRRALMNTALIRRQKAAQQRPASGWHTIRLDEDLRVLQAWAYSFRLGTVPTDRVVAQPKQVRGHMEDRLAKGSEEAKASPPGKPSRGSADAAITLELADTWIPCELCSAVEGESVTRGGAMERTMPRTGDLAEFADKFLYFKELRLAKGDVIEVFAERQGDALIPPAPAPVIILRPGAYDRALALTVSRGKTALIRPFAWICLFAAAIVILRGLVSLGQLLLAKF